MKNLNSVTSECSSSPDVNAPAAAPSPTVAGAPFPKSRSLQLGIARPSSQLRPLSPQVVAAAADPGPCGWASTDLQSALASETMADSGHWPATADPADPVAVSFEAEVSALEAGWLCDGIVMNATAFLLAALNSSADNSDSSVTVSA